jgi:acyl carrier protein
VPSDVDDQLAALWTELLECETATGDADFFDSGGTSITAVHLAALIQETFGVSVDAIEVVVLRTFAQLSTVIATRMSAKSSS